MASFLLFSKTVATVVFFFIFSTSSLATVDHHNNPAPLPVSLVFWKESKHTTTAGISIGMPVLKVTLHPVLGDLATDGIKDSSSCLRIPVNGISRLNLLSYASLFHVSLDTSTAIAKKLDSKIHVCFHGDNSLGWCQCQKDEWRSVQKGTWSAAMSPFENRYVDVRFNGQISAPVTVSLVEDLQERFVVCLALGFVLLLIAPVISSWVLYCCSHSKAKWVLLVTIILLFQLGAESFPSHQFSVIVNYILQTLGLGEEMHHLVVIFLLLGIIFSGAAFGYWTVRRFVISREDGTVDAGVVGFVKLSMHIMGIIFIFQSTEDHPLALGVLISWEAVCCLIRNWLRVWYEIMNGRYSDSPTRIIVSCSNHCDELGAETSPSPSSTAPQSDQPQVQHEDVRGRNKFSEELQVYKRRKFMGSLGINQNQNEGESSGPLRPN